MARATLALSIPEGIWIGDISRSHPEATIRILAALADDASGVGLAELRAADPEPLIAAMRDDEAVTDLEVLRTADEAALVQFETTLPLLLFAAQDSGVPIEMPFDIEAGEATWTLTAPRDRIAELGEQLEAFGIAYTVERIETEGAETDPLLTDRQSELLTAAVDHGYYDVPRSCTLTELADAEGLAKSTLSEILQRAEGTVLKRFVAEELPD